MVATWLRRLQELLALNKDGNKGRLTPACQVAINNIAQRLLVADQAVKQATQPITNRGFFEAYIDKGAQLSLDYATHDYYYDKQFSRAARASADFERRAEVLHRHMRLLRKSLRTRLKGTAEMLHSVQKQRELGMTAGNSDAGPTQASVKCVFALLDDTLEELNASKERAFESSQRLKLRPKTAKQLELCFTQLDLALENLKNDLGPLKQALKDTAKVVASQEKKN